MKKELSITDVIDVLWEKKILFLIILIIFFLAGILSYYVVPKKYLLVNKLYHVDITENNNFAISIGESPAELITAISFVSYSLPRDKMIPKNKLIGIK